MGIVSPSGAMSRKRNLSVTPNIVLGAVLMVVVLQGFFYMAEHYSNRYHAAQEFNSTEYMLRKFEETSNFSALLLSRVDHLENSAVSIDQNVMQNQDANQKVVDALLRQLQSLEKTATSLKDSMSQKEQENSEMAGAFTRSLTMLYEKLSSVKESSSAVQFLLTSHLKNSIEFRPLKDLSKWHHHGENGINGFMSDVIGRGRKEGPPELFQFPSNVSGERLLCMQGNNTNNGTKNYYAFAHREALPPNAVFLNGTTLIADTFWDYSNPWHSMYNLIQFVHWQMGSESQVCRAAHRLVLYHWGEVRTELGYWIGHILNACNLPTEPEHLSYEGRPVCFENVLLSRSGLGGVPVVMLRKIYEEVRCQSRRKCGVVVPRPGPTEELTVRVTLMIRTGSRGFINVADWEEAVASQCTLERGCTWVKMFVSNLTFCEQVAMMTNTDILVTVHGAQLTNMVFMSPGSRVLEMFPRGWLEFASHGQFIYSHLASWVGLKHEGYWRDLNTPACPTPTKDRECFSFYKDQPVGINKTHIQNWLGSVILDFNNFQFQQAHPLALPQANLSTNVTGKGIKPFLMSWDNSTCFCQSYS